MHLYGLGTNAGLKPMAANNRDVDYADLLYVRRRSIEKAALREAIRRVVNATLAARLEYIGAKAPPRVARTASSSAPGIRI